MGYKFEVVPADIDEKAIRSDIPKDLVFQLAHAKATALIPRLPKTRSLLITSDQVVVAAGKIFEKPTNVQDVLDFFNAYREYPVETVTSVVVTFLLSGTRMHGIDLAQIRFGLIPREVLMAYVDTGDPFLHTGGFDHEHPTISPYVKWIKGEPSSITGLPRTLTQRLLNVFIR